MDATISPLTEVANYLIGNAKTTMTKEQVAAQAEAIKQQIATSGTPNIWAAILDEMRQVYAERFLTSQTGIIEGAAIAPTTLPTIDTTAARRSGSLNLAEVANGFYTVQFPDGEHVTVKVSDWKSRNDGSRVVSVLVGPDNTSDYEGLGTVTPEGEYHLWSRQATHDKAADVYSALVELANGGLERRASSQEAYALRSSRCARCGRMLTVPASIHRGLGSECASRM